MAAYWSRRALRNLQDIVSHIQRDSPQSAGDFARKTLRSVARLASFPESGRKVPELEDQSPAPREIFAGDYRILYRVRLKNVEIVAIVHGRRLLPPL